MKKFDRTIRINGFITAVVLFFMLFVIFFAYNLLTWGGLSYFNTKNDIAETNFAKGGGYAKTTVTQAYTVLHEDGGTYFLVPCSDGHTAFILHVEGKRADKMEKRFFQGRSVKVRGKLHLLTELEYDRLANLGANSAFRLDPTLLRKCSLDYMSFGDYVAEHKLLNLLLVLFVILDIFFIVRFSLNGSMGKIRRSARKYNYPMENIREDFELAQKHGNFCIGNSYFFILSLSPDVVKADDIVLAYKHLVVEKASYYFIPVFKQKLFSLVLVSKLGKEYEIKYSTEKKVDEALKIIRHFEHITVSETDEFRNAVRANLDHFADMSKEKILEREIAKDEENKNIDQGLFYKGDI